MHNLLYPVRVLNAARNILIFLAFLLCMTFSSVQVQAQQSQLRVSQNSNYDRLVIESASPIKYRAEESSAGKNLTLTLLKDIRLSTEELDQASFRFISNIALKNVAGLPVVDITGNSGTSYRYFAIGKKVIIDIFGQSTGTKAVKIVDDQTSAPAPKTSPNTQETSSAPVRTVSKEDISNQSGSSLRTLEKGQINLSSTRSFGMNVYLRNGFLYIVTDLADIAIPPQVIGDIKNVLKDPDIVSVEGGTIYLYEWPFIMTGTRPQIRAEGGGLLWRLIIGEEDSSAVDGRLRVSKNGGKNNFFIDFSENIRNVVHYEDPVTAERISSATMSQAGGNAYLSNRFAQFSLIPSIIGAALVEKVDGLVVEKVSDKETRLSIGAPEKGLNITEKALETFYSVVSDFLEPTQDFGAGEGKQYYAFDRWAGGGVSELDQNRQILERKLAEFEPGQEGHLETVINLAKLHLANYFPQEALGYFDYAGEGLAGMADAPEFLSLKAAAETLAGQALAARRSFSHPALSDITELNYWRAYNEGRLENWAQSYALTPRSADTLLGYPEGIRYEIALTLAEAALREQDVKRAKEYLDIVQKDLDSLWNPYLSNYKYLLGELRRQEDDNEKALELWRELLEEGDKLFRAKAGLSWVKLSIIEGAITPDRGIEILEQLRFTWRGDGLETQINHELGRAYIQIKDYKKALTVLKDAASNANDEGNRAAIVQDMKDTFNSLFLGELRSEITAIQAVTIYEAFSELLPTGDEGNKIVFALVDKLVEVDLIARAGKLLTQLAETRLEGPEKDLAYLRLARLKLIEDKPLEVLEVLERLDLEELQSQPQAYKEKIILEAKALSETGRVGQALNVLNRLGDAEELDRMKADIAWSNNAWNDAANSLVSLIGKKRLAAKDKLTNDDAKLILNAAVAISLAGDFQRLQNFQTRFETVMSETPFGKLFKIVTRPPGDSFLSSRETILRIVDEVDLFQGILEQF